MRPSQTDNPELTDDLLALVRRHLYPDETVNFNKDKRALLELAILWPAVYLDDRGVDLSPERYKEIFLDVMMTALRQGNTGNIKWRPAWLGKCIQSHFEIHWEEIYAEAKSTRTFAERAMRGASKIPVQPKPSPVREMALAARLLKGTGRKKKTALKAPLNEQLNLV